MDLHLTPRQRELRELAAAIGHTFRARRPAPDAALDRTELLALLQELNQVGYCGSTVPVAAGGAGLTHLEFGQVIEGIAESFPFLGCHNAARYLFHGGTPTQQERWLGPACRGELINSTGMTEPLVGSDAAAMQCRAERTDGGWLLTGQKHWITHGSLNDLTFVVATADPALGAKGLVRLVVERTVPYTAADHPTLGLQHLRFSTLTFDGAPVPAGCQMGQVGEGLRGALAGMPVARAVVAATATGLARRALALASAYVKERRQFGRPIGALQLIQGEVAEMAARVEACHLMGCRAFQALDAGGPALAETAMAKFFCTELAVEVCHKAMNVMGANGLAAAFEVERLFRDARMLLVPDGTAQINRLILGRELLGLSAFR